MERIELPEVGDPWREALTGRARSARSVLTARPWALGMMVRQNPGPALLQHHNRLLGVLMTEGFSAALATHAFSAIDAYVYGFALTETSLPFEPGDGAEEAFPAAIAAFQGKRRSRPPPTDGVRRARRRGRSARPRRVRARTKY